MVIYDASISKSHGISRYVLRCHARPSMWSDILTFITEDHDHAKEALSEPSREIYTT